MTAPGRGSVVIGLPACFPILPLQTDRRWPNSFLDAFCDAQNRRHHRCCRLPDHQLHPQQIVTNAEKALDHAGFFGPGTITGFDAVSLNISGDRRYQAGDIAGAIG
jgi:hypothetical protein